MIALLGMSATSLPGRGSHAQETHNRDTPALTGTANNIHGPPLHADGDRRLRQSLVASVIVDVPACAIEVTGAFGLYTVPALPTR